MTQSFATNSTNDLFLDASGNLAFVSGIYAAEQNCKTAMLMLQGEAMYAKQSGMPYQTTAWDNYQPILFEAAARNVLLAVQDVVEVIAFDQSLIDNVLRYEATIRTIYGTVTFSNI